MNKRLLDLLAALAGVLTIIAGIIPDLRYQRYRYPEENIMIT